MISHATYINLENHIKNELQAFYSPRGGYVDVGMLSEYNHKINLSMSEDLLLNEGVVYLLWIIAYTASLSRQ